MMLSVLPLLLALPPPLPPAGNIGATGWGGGAFPGLLPPRQDDPLLDPALTVRRTAVVEVVERAKPAVVSIDSNFRPRSFFEGGGRGTSGTGVVIYEEGFIVTNFHVISNNGQPADRILVRFDEIDDDRVYEARLINFVQEEDLALIKIDGDRPFPTVPLSDAEPLLGESVVAIGNAVGHTHTVSTGIISGLHRDVTVPSHRLSFSELIQTDASINPGNSGGPLLDITGQLIGINTVMRGAAQNIGFAIPVAKVQQVLSSHLLSLDLARAYIGFEVDEETFEVTGVVPSGPSDTAGIRVGDRLVAIDGRPIEDAESYRLQRLAIQPRAEVRFGLLRAGREHEVAFDTWNPADGYLFDHVGFTVVPVSFTSRRLLQVDQVDPLGPAARIGLQAGDVIAAVRAQGSRSRQPARPLDLVHQVGTALRARVMEIEVFRDDNGNDRYEPDEMYRGVLDLQKGEHESG